MGLEITWGEKEVVDSEPVSVVDWGEDSNMLIAAEIGAFAAGFIAVFHSLTSFLLSPYAVIKGGQGIKDRRLGTDIACKSVSAGFAISATLLGIVILTSGVNSVRRGHSKITFAHFRFFSYPIHIQLAYSLHWQYNNAPKLKALSSGERTPQCACAFFRIRMESGKSHQGGPELENFLFKLMFKLY